MLCSDIPLFIATLGYNGFDALFSYGLSPWERFRLFLQTKCEIFVSSFGTTSNSPNCRTMASTSGRRTLKRTSTKITPSQSGDAIIPTQTANTLASVVQRNQLDRHDSSSYRRAPSPVYSSSSLSSSNSTSRATSDTTLTSHSSIEKPNSKTSRVNAELKPQRSKSLTPPSLSDLSKDPIVAEQILLKLKSHIPHLLQTFCILDLQSYGNPIVAKSTDLLPKDAPTIPDIPHFIHGEYLGQSWQITSEKFGDNRHKYRLTISGDLHDPSHTPHEAQQRFYGHLDLTELVNAVRRSQGDVCTSEDPEPDIWLTLAIEELEAKGTLDVRRPPKRGVAHKVSRKDQLDLAMELIRSIHQDYFILQRSDVAGAYNISLVSPSLLEGDGLASEAHHLSAMTTYLKKGERFCYEASWGGARTIYCIPIVGQCESYWLCFVVGNELPAVW